MCGAVMAALVATGAQAQQLSYGTNLRGTPGLIDMPSAHSPADAEIGLSYTRFTNTTRSALTFQLTPRLSTSFRYNQLYDIRPGGSGSNRAVFDFVFDRSFSLHYRIMDEGRYRPAVAVGLNDFLGTGFFESEYIVASKTLTPSLRATLGLGWGRFGTQGGFENPLGALSGSFDARGARTVSNTGGEVDSIEWFRGDAALFGGLQYQINDRTLATVEYSSDAYPFEDGTAFDVKSPVNVAVSYDLYPGLRLTGAYLYGSEAAINLSYNINPKVRRDGNINNTAPLPVRPQGTGVAASWDAATDPQARGPQTATATALSEQDIALYGLTLSGDLARVAIVNDTYRTDSQAIGRTARTLTYTLPDSIARYEIVVMRRNLPVVSATLRRSDLTDLEFDADAAFASYARAGIDTSPAAVPPTADPFPRLDFGVAPFISTSLFDPDSPVRLAGGLSLTGDLDLAPGLRLSGDVRSKLLGNLDDATRRSNSVLPRVRSEKNIYDREQTTLNRLTASYLFRPGTDLYGRATAGYLEYGFAGVSTELLWAPAGRRYALGADLNRVRQRDFDQRLGLRDYTVTTGHLSAYYDFDDGYFTQLDLGRYLAGDDGGTLTVGRRFDNGWNVEAYATLTDVSFDDFGEGSFDKGIRVTIPFDFLTGQDMRRSRPVLIQPILRDGGARLSVQDRLYPLIEDSRTDDLQRTWGQFWR
ncbi:YjbH domain-containing protein [Loktanella sp. TSTF-M6]|uniref:YjbH domain-containing protein n=1 Tax=Loktanella gaetbuli TaxID=2881335 RepID=A0ABS8BVK9_9RHOB|nr:YjbH domain-containing protein [Loktanella gaetbuli]MCB5199749.1 YjbH domain-containing protein [Loktanella gaetbuli]